MADSEGEVDVEDISETEDTGLRDITMEDQSDKWYDKSSVNQSLLSPSNASFSSEYCDPNSWLLDSNSVWSLDPCTVADEKSKTVIEKMLLEEQMYIYRSATKKMERSSVGDKRKQTLFGRSTSPKVKKHIAKTAKEMPLTHRKPWTTEEQEQFEQGLNLYGRSWTRIASMISTRTSLQVKNYANQYFKQKKRNEVKWETAAHSLCPESSCSGSPTGLLAAVIVRDNATPDDRTSSIATVETFDSGSDEDVEIDIDGSDSDGSHHHLMPGQTTSCPEKVYSSLISAAAEENAQDLTTAETKSIGVDGRDGALSSTESSPCPEQQSELAVSQDFVEIPDENLVIETPIYLNEVEITSTETADLSSLSAICEQDSSILQKRDISEEIRQENHLAHEEQHCQSNDSPSPINDIEVAITANMSCDNVSTKNMLEHLIGDCEKLPKCGGMIGQLTSPIDVVRKDWVPLSCGEVTSCVATPSTDRGQLDANISVSVVNNNVPFESIVIERNSVQDVEKIRNSEFFLGRALKTPERYMKIRNYILDMWEKNKPNYLFKTNVRAGLRNCGDVNSIGRVHAFLEDIGAINEGCFDRPVPRIRQQGQVSTDDKEDVRMESWVNSLRPRRKRRIKPERDWLDAGESEGMTIEHLSPEEVAQRNGLSSVKLSPSPPRKRSSRSKASYDPFLLVPCRKFPSCRAVPFDVGIQSEALVVMDAHAHFSTTEVIGLLGGKYFHESRTLQVSKAIPCRSLSTGLQCEMDPVSQTQASEELAGRGLCVVGWYHSHPTFAPIPSVRDIETQAKFQEWFGKGGAPFIGIIISPYNYSNPSNQSQIRCVTISKEWDSAGQYRLPYQFDYKVLSDDADEADTEEQVKCIADDYKTYPFRVQLNRRFGSSANFTILDKLTESLRSRLKTCNNERDAFLHRLLQAIATNFKSPTSLQDCRHDEAWNELQDNGVDPASEEHSSEISNTVITSQGKNNSS